MTHRLAVQNPDKLIVPIVRSLCPNMFKISTRDLRDCLEQLDTWEPVKVDPREKRFAKLALDNMLACAG
jgi:quinolinate synthase